MTTVGFDFGTHQTKICFESIESGTSFYEVFRFRKPNGEDAETLPSFIRLAGDGRLRYGYEALGAAADGTAITYFKQVMFSWSANANDRAEAERWSVLYLAYVILKLDARFGGPRYIVQMGMPTDADPVHYKFCKHQAIKVMASAMQLARETFRNDLVAFLNAPNLQLKGFAKTYLDAIPQDDRDARRRFPIFVFPEAYAALIPLINDHKLPNVGPNLFVDIGGGTVDISFFTNQMDEGAGRRCPCLYYYYSIPYGLNVITGQDLKHSHNVDVNAGQMTWQNVVGFHAKMLESVDTIMTILRRKYEEMGRTGVMPFVNLCRQVLQGRPVCYSGGGSILNGLKIPLQNSHDGLSYEFSNVTTVSELIEHSKLYVDDRVFHVLATAFALSHSSLRSLGNRSMEGVEPDSIKLVSVEKLFSGVRIPTVLPVRNRVAGYVTGFGNSELIKTDFNTDYQRAQSGDPQACLRVGLYFLQDRRNADRANSYLKWALKSGVEEAREPLEEVRKMLANEREIARKLESLYASGLAAKAQGDWTTAHRYFKEAAAAGHTGAAVEISNRAKFIKRCRAEGDRERQRQECERVRKEKLACRGAELAQRLEPHEKEFASGNFESGIAIARIYLEYLDLPGSFDKARDWLNDTKDRGVVDAELLTRFAEIFESKKHPKIHNYKEARKFFLLARRYGGPKENVQFRKFMERWRVIHPKHGSRKFDGDRQWGKFGHKGGSSRRR